MKHSPIASALVAAAALAAAFGAHAQTAGQAMVEFGWNNISPQVRSGDLSPPSAPDTQIGVGSAGAVLVTASYMFTDNWSWEFLAGLPYRHDITGAGAIAGVGRLGTVHQISPTAMLQYRFLPAYDKVRPYVGLGITYAVFYDTEGSAVLTALLDPGGKPVTIGSDRSVGASGQVGVTVKLNDQWFLDASVLKTYISSSLPLSTGQSLSARLNPVSTNVTLGYRF